MPSCCASSATRGGRRAPRRGARLRPGRGGDRARALAGRAAPVPRDRRRAGVLRREARLRRDRSQGGRRAGPGDRGVRAGAFEERDLDAQGAMTASDPLARDRETAVGIAREAGRILMEGWGTRPAVDFKSEDINLVTEFDKRSEALIVE